MDVKVAMAVINGIFNFDSLPALLFGFGVGVLIVCFLWLISAKGGKKKLKKQQTQREKLMYSIGELIADADTMSASFRCGGLKWEIFSKGLTAKVNDITRELKTNMHLFDVFFAKYVEMQIGQYITVLENPERRGQRIASPSDTGLRFTPVVSDVEEQEAAVQEAPAPAKQAAPAAIEKAEEPDDIEEPIRACEPVEAREVQQTEEIKETAADKIAEEVKIAEKAEVKTLPADEDEFELPAVQQSAPAIAPVSRVEHAPAPIVSEPPPEPEPELEPEQDNWSEKSIEEYEAGFAQFEETGYFQITNIADENSGGVSENAAPSAAAPEAAAVSAPTEQAPAAAASEDEEEEFLVDNKYTPRNVAEDHVTTETVCIDRAPLSAPPLASSERQTPSVAQSAPITPPAVHAAPTVPAQTAEVADEEEDGITGDDVMNSIDSFFNLKKR